MPAIYTEENGFYQIDCSQALWSTNRIHDEYQDAAHAYGEIGFLCDVDFVIETDENLLLVEYKNANVVGAANPAAFQPTGENKLQNVAKKYFDSLHWLTLAGKSKPKKYIYVLEYPAGNSTSRLMVRNLLRKKLPFMLQTHLSSDVRKLIEEVRVLNIAEWNSDPELGAYPFLPIVHSDT